MTNTTAAAQLPEIMPLQLTDLVPQNATFTLSTMPDDKDAPRTEIHTRRWSILIRKWAIEKFGAKVVQNAFNTLEINIISEIAYKMLSDESRKLFKDADDFLDKIVTVQDQLSLMTAISKNFGIGEPEMKKFMDAFKKEAPQKVESENADDPKPTAPNP